MIDGGLMLDSIDPVDGIMMEAREGGLVSEQYEVRFVQTRGSA